MDSCRTPHPSAQSHCPLLPRQLPSVASCAAEGSLYAAGDWTRLGSQKERIRLQYMAKARPELLDATTNPGVPGGGPKGVQWMRQVLVPDSVKDGHGDKGSQIALRGSRG